MELVDELANELRHYRHSTMASAALAEHILAIPRIRDALLLMQTAQRRFGEAVRPTDPTAALLAGYANSHPWANLLTRGDFAASCATHAKRQDTK